MISSSTVGPARLPGRPLPSKSTTRPSAREGRSAACRSAKMARTRPSRLILRYTKRLLDSPPRAEVEAILGTPLQDRAWGSTGTILAYARSHPVAFWSSVVWIHLEDSHVQTVSAQRVPLLGRTRTVYHTGAGELPPYGKLPAFETDEFEATFGPCRGLSAIWEGIRFL